LEEAVLIAFDAYALSTRITDPAEFSRRVEGLGSVLIPQAIFVLICIHMAVCVVVLCGALQLIFLHIYLLSRHITAYEFVLEQRFKKQARKVAAEKAENPTDGNMSSPQGDATFALFHIEKRRKVMELEAE
jgi:hypothetical protein